MKRGMANTQRRIARSLLKLLTCITILQFFAFPTYAHGYLDPGTGSIILQGILAAFVVGGMYIRGIRDRIKTFFMRLRGSGSKSIGHETPRDEKTD